MRQPLAAADLERYGRASVAFAEFTGPTAFTIDIGDLGRRPTEAPAIDGEAETQDGAGVSG